MNLEKIIESHLIQLLEDESNETIKKALSIKEPNGIDEYTEDFVNNQLDLLRYAISLQKKEVIKSDDSKSQVAILSDLQDKLTKWVEYSEDTFKDTKKQDSSKETQTDDEEDDDGNDNSSNDDENN